MPYDLANMIKSSLFAVSFKPKTYRQRDGYKQRLTHVKPFVTWHTMAGAYKVHTHT